MFLLYIITERQYKKSGLWRLSQTAESIHMQRSSYGLLWHILSVIKEAKIGIEEIAVSSVPDDPIWHSETIEVDITFKVIEFDMSSTSVF